MTTPTSMLTRAILRSGVTPASKLVLLDLVHIADDTGVANVSPRTVADRTKLTSRGVYKALDALAVAGFATCLTAPDVQWAQSRRWQLHADRIAATGGDGE